MRLGEIDLTLKPIADPVYTLCKPDRTEISRIKDIFNPVYSLKLGKVNELNFTIPTLIERNHQLIHNPLIDKIRHRYLLKVEHNHQTDYLVFLDENKDYSDSGEEISYRLYSEGITLADKIIRDYTAESKTLTYMLNEILSETNWKHGYVDSYYDVMYRQHEITSSTVLQAVYELAEKFNAVIIWDTVNYRINFHNPDRVGLNKGLRFKEGKYLESFGVNTNSEEVITRLRLYGKEGLSIRSLTPTGANYLEDFSYYMYPFEQDSTGKVIQSSYYMSDALCIALNKYSAKLEAAKGEFDKYLTDVDIKLDDLQQRQQELSVLEADLATIKDEIDVLNANGLSGSAAHRDAISRRDQKQSQINAKKAQISTLMSQIDALDSSWASKRSALVVEANLTPEQLIELNYYIGVKEHVNDTIIDPEDLLKEGLDVFKQFREPKVQLNLSIVNFLSNIEEQNNWGKLALGDIVETRSRRLNIDIEAKLIEIQYNFEDKDIDLVIANEKELKDDYAKWTEQLYQAGQTATQVNYNKFKWDLIEETNGVVSQILQEAWDATKRGIVAGYKQNITIDERGIVVKSPSNPMNMVVIQAGVVAVSNNGGEDFKNAITSEGIIGERIIGRLLMGTRLIIEDENGIIRFSGSLQEVFDREGNVKVAIGEYEPDKYGIRIDGGALEIVHGLPKSQIDPEAVGNWDNAEGNAKGYADQLYAEIEAIVTGIEGELEDLQGEIGDSFRDGIIDEAEAIAIARLLDELSISKDVIDRKYTDIKTEADALAVVVSTLTNRKHSLNTAFTDLVNAINNAIADKKTTPAEKTLVDNSLSAYRTALVSFEEAMNAAVKNIGDKKSDNAKAHADGKDTAIREDLRLTAPLPTNLTLNAQGITATSSTSSTTFARLDYRGLYAQNGALDIRTGTASNRGVIIDGSGIRGYNSVGTQTFNLTTNGYLTATTGTFGGSLSAATGTFSGSLSAATGTFSGNLSAAGGTFSGNLSAAGGTFSGSLSAATGTFSGSVTANGSISVTNAGITDLGSTSTSVRIWAGSTESNRNTAAFRVQQNGAVYASNMNITGGSISVSDNITVGNTLNIGASNTTATRKIAFGGNSAWISSSSGRLDLDATNTYVTGNLTLNSSYTVSTANVSAGTSVNLTLTGAGGRLELSSSSAKEMILRGSTSTVSLGSALKWTSTGLQVRLGNDGGFASISASSFSQDSKRSSKKNITPLPSEIGIHTVRDVKIYTYNLINTEKGKEDVKHVGLILDEAPDLIKSETSIDLYGMASLTMKAVQELIAKVEQLEDEVARLKNQ